MSSLAFSRPLRYCLFLSRLLTLSCCPPRLRYRTARFTHPRQTKTLSRKSLPQQAHSSVCSVVKWGRRHSGAVEEQIQWMGLGSLNRRPSDDVGIDDSGKNCQDSKMKNTNMGGGAADLYDAVPPKPPLLCAESYSYHSRCFGALDGNMRDGLALGDH
ncbi:uncharacterized protein FOBCDRAFT_201885 [Fusarium oxysporum Fo47]|uniref:uncharacterized protein n=1 Tax=Fusarium oxysporum Fo47 TaxID=660027 RepID=UPI002869844C|nr:uncharacterized protein FOBCDRAFT_201885 [Fusarium oxysporum Fo47]WJG35360.1 hypothetical protein FOBCDRAFT_201885 [Fusarium oxysporum Fo47]